MAEPQKENGYTPIANEIMDALCRIRIPGEERQILDCIFRKTYGWNKCEDAISLTQFMEMTGLKKPHIVHSINGLLLKKVILIAEKGNGFVKVYKFNKNYDQWNPLPKKVTLPKKVIGVAEKGNNPLPKKGTTKETTKDTITKDNYILSSKEIISYLNKKTNKNFSYKTKSTITHIKARLIEGRTVGDFKIVIDNKCAKWLPDVKMVDFLRPETLFGNKFESYLNEKIHPLSGKVSETTIQNIESFNNWRPPV